MKPGYWLWREWRLGIGRFKGGKPRDPKTRPDVPKFIPLTWWVRYALMLHHRIKPKPTRIYMYDDVNVSLIPRTAKAAAGYVDGRWQTYLKLRLRCPLAKLVSIAVFPSDNADVLDCEPGDAANSQAPAWVKRQRARRKLGAKHTTRLPALYTSASNGEALIAVCTKAGLAYGSDYLWWSAHYDPSLGEHICNPKCYPGLKHTAHATQFTDHAGGKSLDESVCGPDFFA